MPFKRPGWAVVVVTDFGPEDDRLPRHELQTAGDDGIKPLKARALTLRVVKEFQAGTGIEPRRHRVGQVIDRAEPVREADAGDVISQAIKAFELVVEPRVELVRVNE